jgi:hypothetical protein
MAGLMLEPNGSSVNCTEKYTCKLEREKIVKYIRACLGNAFFFLIIFYYCSKTCFGYFLKFKFYLSFIQLFLILSQVF